MRFHKRFEYIIQIEYIYFPYERSGTLRFNRSHLIFKLRLFRISRVQHEKHIKQNDHISKCKRHFSNSESAVDLHIECDACIFHAHNVKVKHFRASALRNEIAFIFSSGHTFKIVHNLNTIEKVHTHSTHMQIHFSNYAHTYVSKNAKRRFYCTRWIAKHFHCDPVFLWKIKRI